MTHLINSHISGPLMVLVSIIIQTTLWAYIYVILWSSMLKILFVVIFPLYFVVSSFFIFYSVNLVYNVIVPPKWIEQNSKYLAYTSPFPIQQHLQEHNAKLELETTHITDLHNLQLKNMEENSIIVCGMRPKLKKSKDFDIASSSSITSTSSFSKISHWSQESHSSHSSHRSDKSRKSIGKIGSGLFQQFLPNIPLQIKKSEPCLLQS